jgi:TonB family protein
MMHVTVTTALLALGLVAGVRELTLESGDSTPGEVDVTERVAPQFPRIAVQARISAEVAVDVRVAADGHPVSAEARVLSTNVPSSSARVSSMFEAPAVDAALQWRFKSALPIDEERKVTITFIFTAKVNDSPVENNEQQAQREIVIRKPLELEVIEAPYVCYLPGETTRK